MLKVGEVIFHKTLKEPLVVIKEKSFQRPFSLQTYSEKYVWVTPLNPAHSGEWEVHGSGYRTGGFLDFVLVKHV